MHSITLLVNLFSVLFLLWSTQAGGIPSPSLATARDDVTELQQQATAHPATTSVINSTFEKQQSLDDDVESLLSRHRRSIERDNSDTLQSRSLCSWSYVVDHNENRIPVDIQKAANCVNRVAGETTNACYLIYFWTPVRTGYLTSSGQLAWFDDWVRLPVGCTLANRPIGTPAPTTTIPTPFPLI